VYKSQFEARALCIMACASAFAQTDIVKSDAITSPLPSSECRPALTPLLLVPFSVEAYKAKRDLALETILAYRGNQ
jgi:hypothetical protein